MSRHHLFRLMAQREGARAARAGAAAAAAQGRALAATAAADRHAFLAAELEGGGPVDAAVLTAQKRLATDTPAEAARQRDLQSAATAEALRPASACAPRHAATAVRRRGVAGAVAGPGRSRTARHRGFAWPARHQRQRWHQACTRPVTIRRARHDPSPDHPVPGCGATCNQRRRVPCRGVTWIFPCCCRNQIALPRLRGKGPALSVPGASAAKGQPWQGSGRVRRYPVSGWVEGRQQRRRASKAGIPKVRTVSLTPGGAMAAQVDSRSSCCRARGSASDKRERH